MSVLDTSPGALALTAAVALAGCNAATPVAHPSVQPPPRAAEPPAPASDLPVAEDASATAPPADAPRIAVVGDRVFLDNAEVADVSAIQASHHPMPIDGLSNALMASGQKHPTGGLIAVFAFGHDATAAVVKSVLRAAAVAGYPHARLVVRTAGGVGYLDVDARIAAPPSDLVLSTKPPGTSTTSGRLAPEIIQRIVRSHFGKFKRCYEDALRTTPDLAGTVRVKFVIGVDGHVSSALDSGASTLPDPTVIACVAREFATAVFPNPEGGGVVTVEYPIIFSPGAP